MPGLAGPGEGWGLSGSGLGPGTGGGTGRGRRRGVGGSATSSVNEARRIGESSLKEAANFVKLAPVANVPDAYVPRDTGVPPVRAMQIIEQLFLKQDFSYFNAPRMGETPMSRESSQRRAFLRHAVRGADPT